MNENNVQHDIQRKVLARLPSARVHSRFYFIARLCLIALVALVVLALSALVLSFIIFSVHESGEEFLLGFGIEGARVFLSLFPWLLLLADIAFIVLLEWLLQDFKFGYRISLLTLFIGVCVCSVALAALVNLTPLHKTLLDRADQGALPVVGDLYEGIRGSHQAHGVFRGTVSQVSGGELTIVHDDSDHDADDGTQTILLPPGVAVPQVGDRVYIFGTSTGAAVQAYGVGQLAPDQ